MNTYTSKFIVKCPMDDDSIEYTLVLESESMIMVEDINRATDIKTGAFHESIADGLFALLGGRQTITAVHQGVEVKTVRGEYADNVKLMLAIKKYFFQHGVGDWQTIAEKVSRAMS